jgi:hypothetical protein
MEHVNAIIGNVFFNVLITKLNTILRELYGQKLIFGSPQHKDLIRVFMMGTVETCSILEQPTTGRWILESLEPMMLDPNWVPDERFKFNEH